MKQEKEIQKQYESGMTLVSLSKLWRHDPQTIRTIVCRNGGKIRPASNVKKWSLNTIRKEFPSVKKARRFFSAYPSSDCITTWKVLIPCPRCGTYRWTSLRTLQLQRENKYLIGRCKSCTHSLNRKSLALVQKEFSCVRKLQNRASGVYGLLICPRCNRSRWTFLSTLQKQRRAKKPVGQCSSCAKDRGGFITPNGYRIVSVRTTRGRKQRMEHHVVMEKHLGRKLHKNESIHHGPGGRADNRIQNLQLRTKSNHPSGWSEDDMANYLQSTGWIIRKTKKVAQRFHEKATWQ